MASITRERTLEAGRKTSMKNTAIFVLISVPPLVVIPLLLAVLLNSKIPGRNIFRGIYFAPWVLSVTVVGLLWWWIFQSSGGLINYYLKDMGFTPPRWLSSLPWAWISILIATIWWTIGFNMIILLAALQDIPDQLYEAASLDGASPLQTFFRVTVPMLPPVLPLLWMLSTSLKPKSQWFTRDIEWIPRTFTLENYQRLFSNPAYDPNCYLCPGNKRAGGAVNPDYEQTFVFTNDYAALLLATPTGALNVDDLLRAQSERGTCRVVCFSPRHDLTLAGMDVVSLLRVVDTWVEQYEELGADPRLSYVQIFENRGAMMGASNPHPHGQIWATEHIPVNVRRETDAQLAYYRSKERSLLADYLALELDNGSRVVCANDSFVALVPFWAVWPFETLLVCREPVGALPDLGRQQRADLADILKRLTTRYDNLFGVSFPYSMGFHQRPTGGEEHPEWHLHAHFYPPFLRSATVRKFMVGFEMLAEPQRDITPELAAERLRAQPETRA